MLLKLSTALLLVLGSISTGLFAIDGVIVVTTDQAFHDKWHYTLGTYEPEISKAESIYIGQKFAIHLFLTDYGVDSDYRANVSYDLEVYNPDHQLIFEKPGIPAFRNQIMDTRHVILGESSLKVSLDSTEKMGTYRIYVRMYDWVDSVYQEIETSFDLINLEYESVFERDEDFLDWHERYYLNPRPELALDGFIYFAGSELRLDEANYWPMFSFFLEIYKANPFLLPELASLYHDQVYGTRIHLLYLLRFAGYIDDQFLSTLDDEERGIFNTLLTQELIPTSDPVSAPRDLDVLWSVFLATGNYSSISKLVNNLEYAYYKGAGQASRSAPEPAKDLQATLYEGIYQNALLTLVTSCETHPLVKSYCNYLYMHGELSDLARRELEELLLDK